MKVGFIGYGNMAEALASRWAHQHDITIGGRDIKKAQSLANQLGHNTKWGVEADAVASSDIVVLATRHEFTFDAMEAAGGPSVFNGKTLVDT